MKVKRVAGGLTEVLDVGGRGVLTTRGEPFEVPDAFGKALLDDGTGRFEEAGGKPAKKGKQPEEMI